MVQCVKLLLTEFLRFVVFTVLLFCFSPKCNLYGRYTGEVEDIIIADSQLFAISLCQKNLAFSCGLVTIC